MNQTEVRITHLENGLTVLLEEIPEAQSVAYELHIPGGILHDDPTRIGSSLILAELISRGAGDLDAFELSNAFDDRGINHSESGGGDRYVLRGSALADDLSRGLELLALMVLSPRLPENEIESIRSLFLQDIASLPDHPSRRVMIELSGRYFPEPYRRSSLGTESGLKNTDIKSLKKDWEQKFRPNGAILSIAGKIQAHEVLSLVQRLFGEWKGEALSRPTFGTLSPHSTEHVPYDSAQLQVALAYPSAPYGDSDYYTAKVTTQILSGGMFGRLFTEVREKRGLCYSISARHSASNEYGLIIVYAGTTTERAQETLDVTRKELKSVMATVTQEELQRAKANLKASLIIGEETSGARASSNAGDWWMSKSIRTEEEILSAINGVTVNRIDEHLGRFPSDSCMLVTLGAKPLHCNE